MGEDLNSAVERLQGLADALLCPRPVAIARECYRKLSEDIQTVLDALPPTHPLDGGGPALPHPEEARLKSEGKTDV